MSQSFIKDPDSVLDYKFDWSTWLNTSPADTISSSSVTVSSGLTLDSDTNDTTSATAWVSGGSVGSSYTVTNRIVTAAGRTADRSITIKVIQR